MQWNTLISVVRYQPARFFSVSHPCALIQKWRKERGLPLNPNTCGILTDKADYTFLDGRPTPLGRRQKDRVLKQQAIATKIIQLSSEVDFALHNYSQKQLMVENAKEDIIKNKLKKKGKQILL